MTFCASFKVHICLKLFFIIFLCILSKLLVFLKFNLIIFFEFFLYILILFLIKSHSKVLFFSSIINFLLLRKDEKFKLIFASIFFILAIKIKVSSDVILRLDILIFS